MPRDEAAGSAPGPPRGALGRFTDWLFRDRVSGRYVIGQWPNLPLWLFLAGTVASIVLPLTGGAELALRLATSAALLWWALWEVVAGVNPFRRILGTVITMWVLVGLVRQLVG